MKQRKTSALLTLILAHFILGFAAFTHVVGSLVQIAGTSVPGFAGFTEFGVSKVMAVFAPDFSVIPQIITFGIATLVVGAAFIFALVWAIRLLVFRRKAANLFSPLLFLISVLIGVILVISHEVVEIAFAQATTQVATVYWFGLGVVIIALGLHLLVVGLATSGPVKVGSILPEELEEEFEVIEERVETPNYEDEVVVEPVKEEPAPKVETEEEVVVEPKVIPSETVEDAVDVEEGIDLNDPELHALIRKIANEEIDKRPVPGKVVVQKEDKPEPKVEPKKEVKVKPEPVKEVVAPKKVVEPVEEDKGKVERIPFPKRMQIVEDQVKKDYNELKSYLLSYGINSRISNVADSFRLGRVLYAKLTNSGNTGLKLYLPIKLEDYADSKIPLKSSEGTKQYEDVPVFIYIRSDLSMKRAKQLIDDVMLKNGISRKYDVEEVDHVKALAE